MSPVEVKVPMTIKSDEMIDGADRDKRFPPEFDGSAGKSCDDSGFFPSENISSYPSNTNRPALKNFIGSRATSRNQIS